MLFDLDSEGLYHDAIRFLCKFSSISHIKSLWLHLHLHLVYEYLFIQYDSSPVGPCAIFKHDSEFLSLLCLSVSRWRKLHAASIGARRWIMVEGIEFPGIALLGPIGMVWVKAYVSDYHAIFLPIFYVLKLKFESSTCIANNKLLLFLILSQ